MLGFAFILFLTSCERQEAEERCFTKNSLENTAWVKQHLAWFQKPKTGPLRVVVYSYQDQTYLAFENPAISAPMANVFNCSGARLIELNIDYTEVKKQAIEVVVLLEGTY